MDYENMTAQQIDKMVATFPWKVAKHLADKLTEEQVASIVLREPG